MIVFLNYLFEYGNVFTKLLRVSSASFTGYAIKSVYVIDFFITFANLYAFYCNSDYFTGITNIIHCTNKFTKF